MTDPRNSDARLCRIETILHILCDHFSINPKKNAVNFDPTTLKIKLGKDGEKYEAVSSGADVPILAIRDMVRRLESTESIKTTRPLIKLTHNDEEIGHLILTEAK